MLTIVTPAAHRRLTTVAAVKLELGIADSSQDARLQALIERASGMITSYCRRPFAREVVRESFRQPLPDPLILARTPVSAASVTVDDVALLAPDWECDTEAGLLYRLGTRGCRIGWHGRHTVVEYAGGYVLPGDSPVAGAPSLPSEVEQACIALVTSLHEGAGRDPLLRSESVEGVGSSSWLDPRAEAGALPPQVAGQLDAYRAALV